MNKKSLLALGFVLMLAGCGQSSAPAAPAAPVQPVAQTLPEGATVQTTTVVSPSSPTTTSQNPQ